MGCNRSYLMICEKHVHLYTSLLLIAHVLIIHTILETIITLHLSVIIVQTLQKENKVYSWHHNKNSPSFTRLVIQKCEIKIYCLTYVNGATLPFLLISKCKAKIVKIRYINISLSKLINAHVIKSKGQSNYNNIYNNSSSNENYNLLIACSKSSRNNANCNSIMSLTRKLIVTAKLIKIRMLTRYVETATQIVPELTFR